MEEHLRFRVECGVKELMKQIEAIDISKFQTVYQQFDLTTEFNNDLRQNVYAMTQTLDKARMSVLSFNRKVNKMYYDYK